MQTIQSVRTIQLTAGHHMPSAAAAKSDHNSRVSTVSAVQVIKSARVMKKAVGHLLPYIEEAKNNAGGIAGEDDNAGADSGINIICWDKLIHVVIAHQTSMLKAH